MSNPLLSRRALLTLAGLGGFGGFLVWMAVRLGKPRGRPGVNVVNGVLRINNAPAAEGAPVAAGDRLATGPGGSAMVVVGRDAYLLREDTELAFDGEGTTVTGLSLLRGAVLSVFAPKPVAIATPMATIGIRGTGCYVEIVPGGTYVCLCYGRADIQATDGTREDVTTTHHESPRWIRPGAGGPSIQPAPMLNHRDAELILLESLVGRMPPFGDEPMPGY